MATSNEVKSANLSRAQKIELHKENVKDRSADISTLKAEYLKERDNPVLLDILAKCATFADYHVSVGRDGVGADKDGNIIYFTNEKRVSEFDRSAGIVEISDYIKRMIADPAVVAPIERDVDAEELQAETE